MKIPKHAAALCTATLLLMLSACHDQDDNSAAEVPGVAVGGVAAVGAPLSGAAVRLICVGGLTRNTTTADDGSWSVRLPTSALPCAVRVNGGRLPGGTTSTGTLYSVAAGEGETLVSNVTPLTDLALTRAVRSVDGRDLDAWYAAGAPAAAQVATALGVSRAELLTRLRDAGYTVPEGFNPFTDAFQAVAGNDYDDLLEAVGDALEAAGQDFADLRDSYADGGDLPEPPVTPPATAPAVPAAHYIRRHWAILEGVYSFSCAGSPIQLTLNTNGSFSVAAGGTTRNYSATSPDYFFNYDASPGRPSDILVGIGQATQLHFTLNGSNGSGAQPDQKIDGQAYTQCTGTTVSSVYTLPPVIKTFKGSYAASCGDAGAQVLTIGEDSRLTIAGTTVTVGEANSLIAHDSLQSEGSSVFADGTFKLAVVGSSSRSVEVTVDSPTSAIKKVVYRNGSSGATCSVSGPTTEPPAPAPANVKIASKIGAVYAGSYVLSCPDFSTSSGVRSRTVVINADGSTTLDGQPVVDATHPGYVGVVNRVINIARDDSGNDVPKLILNTDGEQSITGATISEQPLQATNCTTAGLTVPKFPLQETVASYARAVNVTCTGDAVSGAASFVIAADGTASLGSITITPAEYLQNRFFEFSDTATFNADSDKSGDRSQIYVAAVGKSLIAYLNRDGSLSSLIYGVSVTTNGVQSTKQGSCTPLP